MPTFELTPKQVELRNAAASPATHILAYGGGRSGKTFGFCYCIGVRAMKARDSRHLISRLHNIDVRQSVMMDTWPKMMRLAFPDVTYKVNKSDQFVTFPWNDAEVWFGGLDDAERVDKILGKEYATIYVNEASQVPYASITTLRTRLAQACHQADGRRLPIKAYYDLNPVGKGHWTHKEFVEGVRPENGLPIGGGARRFVVLNPADNPHLPAETLAEYAALPERQRKRFFEGTYLSDLPDALWPSEIIERHRVDVIPTLTRIVVAVDPSGSDGAGGDRQGIVVVGLGVDGRGYVLEDASCRLAPAGWAGEAVRLYRRWQADLIVAEANYGGAMVESTIRTADQNVPVKLVHASRGKHVRAEPVSALYAQGKVSHVGVFSELEDQMGMFTTDGYQGGDSPDRADALVWGLTELMVSEMKGSNAFELARQQAEAIRAATEQKPPAVEQFAPGSVEYMKAIQGG